MAATEFIFITGWLENHWTDIKEGGEMTCSRGQAGFKAKLHQLITDISLGMNSDLMRNMQILKASM